MERTSMIGKMAIQVGKAQVRENSFEMWWLLGSRKILDGSEIGHSDHANVAIAPCLCCRPFDSISYIFLLSGREMDGMTSFRRSCASGIDGQVTIAPRDNKADLANLINRERKASSLEFFGIAGPGNKNGKGSTRLGSIEIPM